MERKLMEFEKVVYTEPYNISDSNSRDIKYDGDTPLFRGIYDSLMITTAIPIVGTIIIILYFLARSKKVCYRKVKP